MTYFDDINYYNSTKAFFTFTYEKIWSNIELFHIHAQFSECSSGNETFLTKDGSYILSFIFNLLFF